jgi:phosphoglycolate phosphatase
MAYQAVLFDLDGTLTDSTEGITRCISYAMEQLGVPVPDIPTLCGWIGPPLSKSFAAYLQDEALGQQALIFYRERFAEVGIFENRLYPGIPSMLADMQRRGSRLMLATSKPLPYAQRILEHFDLMCYFAVVGGATMDGRVTNKAQVIESLLPHLDAAERAACVMVGDRDVDVYGAHAYNMPCIAVSYGFGSVEELVDSTPERIVHSVAELHTALVEPGEEHARF